MKKYSAYLSQIANLKDDLLKSLEFIQWGNQIEKGSTVFVKPNFTYPYYKEGITTSPELLKYLLEILKNRAGKVIVGESDGGKHSFTAQDAFRGHNMYEICRDVGVDLVNLSEIPSTFVEEPIQGKRVKIQLPNILLNDIDSFISVPVLKVHVMTEVTLSIKNLWGCYPDTMRCLHHKYLSHKLALLTKLIHPKISIIDGINALNGHGPMFGEVKKTNLIISSDNSVVADSLATAIMGIPIDRCNHILIAEGEGLGTTDLSKIEINTDWTKFKMDFNVNKTLIDNLSVLLFNSETLAKLVMDSPCSPFIYGLAKRLRTHEENQVVNNLRFFSK